MNWEVPVTDLAAIAKISFGLQPQVQKISPRTTPTRLNTCGLAHGFNSFFHNKMHSVNSWTIYLKYFPNNTEYTIFSQHHSL